MSKAEYQCPACGWTLTLPVNSKRMCPSCIEDIDEHHLMRPLKKPDSTTELQRAKEVVSTLADDWKRRNRRGEIK